MQPAPIIAISALLVGFVLFAFSIFVYKMFSERRKYLQQLVKPDLDLKSPTRVLTVMDGKVVPMQERRWASTFNGIHWPTYSIDQRGSKSMERSSHNIARDLEAVGNDGHRTSTYTQPQLHLLQQTSDLLGSPVYSPLEPPPHVRATHAKRKKGKHQLEQTQSPKYSYAVKSSPVKAYTTASLHPAQKESHRSTSLSQPATQASIENDTNPSVGLIKKPVSGYSLPTYPRASLSTGGLYDMRTRRASNQRANTSTPLTYTGTNPSLGPVPLRSLPPIVKDLPLSPIRTPEEKPTTPVGNRSFLHPDSSKPNFDLGVLQAASISAIPHSAFYPYRFPGSGSRQPRKSYRGILKSKDSPGSLPIEAPLECGTPPKSMQIEMALPLFPRLHRAPFPPTQTSGKAEFPPRTGCAPQHEVSSNSTQPRLPDPNTALGVLSWLADPSVSASPQSSSSSRHQQQHESNTPETSEDNNQVLHKSFLNPDTPPSESVPDVSQENIQSPVVPKTPYNSSNIAQGHHMANARCVSIYSRFAKPLSRKPAPSPLIRETNRLSSASSWRDKPLPSPRSDHSGHAASATAQSLLVSPLSSMFTPQ
ncbi:hypothetical protein MMC18_003275 [Xylographa bjoerkii]|nr:hypothetical protein [Xylographa bjoerkii]